MPGNCEPVHNWAGSFQNGAGSRGCSYACVSCRTPEPGNRRNVTSLDWRPSPMAGSFKKGLPDRVAAGGYLVSGLRHIISRAPFQISMPCVLTSHFAFSIAASRLEAPNSTRSKGTSGRPPKYSASSACPNGELGGRGECALDVRQHFGRSKTVFRKYLVATSGEALNPINGSLPVIAGFIAGIP
jgi:hypothetical protein